MTDARADLVTAYNRYAAERDARVQPSWRVAERERFLERLRALGARTLLEVGAGPGDDACAFARAGLQVLAGDLAPAMARLCASKGVPALRLDLGALPVAGASCDAVWAVNCLLHLPSAEFDGALGEIARVLRPGGLLYLGQWGGMDSEGIWEDDPYTPKRFFTFQSDETLLARAAGDAWRVLSFHTVDVGRLHRFQALTLERTSIPAAH